MADASASTLAQPGAGPALAAPRLPWSPRQVAGAPLPPLAAGAVVAAVIFAVFLAGEAASGTLAQVWRGEAPPWKLDEYFFAAVMALLLGYTPAAHALGARALERTLRELQPVLRPAAGGDALRAPLPTRHGLRRAGWIGVGIAFLVPGLADLSLDAYRIIGFNSAAVAHRVMLGPVGWLLGRYIHATLVDSRFLAALGRRDTRIDLLDLAPLEAFARHGLWSALRAMGVFAILAPLLADFEARPGLPVLLALVLLVATALASGALWLPMRGVHEAVAAAKRAELAWCASALHRRRGQLAAAGGPDAEGASGSPGAGASGGERDASLAELAAWRQLVQGVRTWPFDTGIALRFAALLGLPVLSWLGGALVERGLDRVLE